VAETLQYIHERGLVRNDLKPGNIMLSTDGRVYLLDFGISKALGDAEQHLTQTGVLVGTPYYMAPEQVTGQSADARSDIYSFGVVLYEMLTGKRPLEGESLQATMWAHLHEAPVPPSHHTPLPADVNSIVLRCLEKNPDDRFQSMADLCAALSDAAGTWSFVDLTPLSKIARESHEQSEGQNNLITKPVSRDEAPAPPAAPPSSPAPFAVEEDLASSRGEAADEAAPLSGDYLAVLNGPSSIGLKLALEGENTTIGRSRDNTLILPSAKVSRHHCRVRLQDDVYYLDDLNTANGTRVNGSMIRDGYPLQDGDQIQVGDYLVEFRRYRSAPPTAGQDGA
jgi:serine/threonine protein kinase